MQEQAERDERRAGTEFREHQLRRNEKNLQRRSGRHRQTALRKRRRRERRMREIRRAILLTVLLILFVVFSVNWISGMITGGAKEDLSASAEAAVSTEEESDFSGATAEVGAEDEEVNPDAGDPSDETNENRAESESCDGGTTHPLNAAFFSGYKPVKDGNTKAITNPEVDSHYGILVDLESGNVIAQRAADEVISPASMTKILTVLVAAEHVKNLDDQVTITQEITDYIYQNDCSAVGFAVGETVPVRDLLYGTILPSGADAALGLANYVAGSQEAFVALMNQKVQELGLSDTAHFANVIGIYDEQNHCTVTDMAMILKAAVENDLAREVLSAHTYTTAKTEQHPEGIKISNWFLRRIEDKDSGGTVQCAKTGYVVQSGNCAASYMESASGKHYICVTGTAHSAWRCIYDHVAIYKDFTA